MNKKIIILCLFLIGYIFFSLLNNTKPTSKVKNNIAPTIDVSTSSGSAVLGQQTKFSNCTIQGKLPDKDCTPGAVFTNVTKDQICVAGYSKSVRNVNTLEKNQVFQEYGILSHGPGAYEIDHYVSLELGGSNDISNLWPEAAEPKPGFHEKDKVENYLHKEVCDGIISLQEAQKEISTDWLKIYQNLP